MSAGTVVAGSAAIVAFAAVAVLAVLLADRRSRRLNAAVLVFAALFAAAALVAAARMAVPPVQVWSIRGGPVTVADGCTGGAVGLTAPTGCQR